MIRFATTALTLSLSLGPTAISTNVVNASSVSTTHHRGSHAENNIFCPMTWLPWCPK